MKPETIGVVDLDRSAPIEDSMDEALLAAGAALGWNVEVTDAGGSATTFISAIDAFANAHVNALIVESNGVSGAQTAVQELQSAKAPIIEIGGQIPPSSAYAAQYSESESKLAALLAHKIVADHPGGARIGDITLTVAYATQLRQTALLQAVKASRGKLTISASTPFDLTNPVVSVLDGVENMITADPKLNVIWGVSDGTVQPALSAIVAKHSDAKLYSFYDDPTSLADLREKKSPLAAVANVNLQVSALVAIDQLVQYFQKGTRINPNALGSTLGLYSIVDHGNVPPLGQAVDPLRGSLKPYLAKWAKEFPVK